MSRVLIPGSQPRRTFAMEKSAKVDDIRARVLKVVGAFDKITADKVSNCDNLVVDKV